MLPEPKRKITSKILDYLLVSYAKHNVAYRFLVLKSDVLDRNIIIDTKNAKLFEYIYPLSHKVSHAMNALSLNLGKTMKF